MNRGKSVVLYHSSTRVTRAACFACLLQRRKRCEEDEDQKAESEPTGLNAHMPHFPKERDDINRVWGKEGQTKAKKPDSSPGCGGRGAMRTIEK